MAEENRAFLGILSLEGNFRSGLLDARGPESQQQVALLIFRFSRDKKIKNNKKGNKS